MHHATFSQLMLFNILSCLESSMATTKVVLALFLCSLFLLALPPPSDATLFKACGFDAIYQLGDSISDTGNLIREHPDSVFARLPYGQNFVDGATGRCSNGMLMIDYLAQSAGLPFLDAYLNPNAKFAGGVNFAVAGSTALPVEVLAGMHIFSPATNTSLTTELDWMSSYFNETCHNQEQDCADKLQTALFMVGEIGGNDYNYALLQGKSIDEVKDMVPQVVQAIKEAVKKVIRYGARRVVVPGNFPIGCMPIYLTAFQTNDTAAYDEFHCLKGLNDFSSYHNEQVKQAIHELINEYPIVAIAYGDYYEAYMWTLSHALWLGYDMKSLQKACCGTGGDYDFSLAKMCGVPGVPVCTNYNQRMSWDGVHLTQEAYKQMANWLVLNLFPQLQCL